MNLADRIIVAAKNQDIEIRTNYSGRGMYGKSCIGIVSSYHQCMQVISDILVDQSSEVFDSIKDADSDERLEQAEDDQSVLHTNIQLLLEFCKDDMGLETIIYWPQIQYIE